MKLEIKTISRKVSPSLHFQLSCSCSRLSSEQIDFGLPLSKAQSGFLWSLSPWLPLSMENSFFLTVLRRLRKLNSAAFFCKLAYLFSFLEVRFKDGLMLKINHLNKYSDHEVSSLHKLTISPWGHWQQSRAGWSESLWTPLPSLSRTLGSPWRLSGPGIDQNKWF